MKKFLTIAIGFSLLSAPIAQATLKDTLKDMAKIGTSSAVGVAVVAFLAYKYCPAFKHRCPEAMTVTREMPCNKHHCNDRCTSCSCSTRLGGCATSSH